jgi:hypothetical protein
MREVPFSPISVRVSEGQESADGIQRDRSVRNAAKEDKGKAHNAATK